MSNEELNRKLAELLGWSDFYHGGKRLSGRRPDEDPGSSCWVPDYCGDLNAVSVVMGLNEDQRSEYRHALVTQWPSQKVDAVDASAKERTEALIRTLEEKP
jgi:hypothetical protein